MSDFIDDPDPATPEAHPDPFRVLANEVEQLDADAAPADGEAVDPPMRNLFLDEAAPAAAQLSPPIERFPTSSPTSSPSFSPMPPPGSSETQPPIKSPLASAGEYSFPDQTGSLERPVVDHYRPSPPIERAVRPIEPLASGLGASSWSNEPTPVEAVPPPARTMYYPAPQATFEPTPQKRWPLALLAIASGLIGALVVAGGLYVAGAFDESVPSTTIAQPIATAPAQTVIVREVVPEGDATAIASAVGRKVVPSIVTVEVGAGDPTGSFSPFGSGSGVVFTEDGLILTNHHVIDGATASRVIFQDGRIYGAEIVGSDALTDVAVLRIQGVDLTPIELGTTEGLEIGDRAIAVGNPLGLNGGASLTVGVVSAFDREVNTGNGSPLFGMLQTDAPITNGSSGGALVNGAGKLIGITTAIGVSESGAEGIGFAIPVEVVRRIADQIIANGSVTHAFLGVSLQTNFEIQPDGAAVPAGAIVAGFGEGSSAAADAGLQLDDVILSWNGNEIGTINDLIRGIRGSSVGDTITLVVERGGETMTFDVVLGQRPEGV